MPASEKPLRAGLSVLPRSSCASWLSEAGFPNRR